MLARRLELLEEVQRLQVKLPKPAKSSIYDNLIIFLFFVFIFACFSWLCFFSFISNHFSSFMVLRYTYYIFLQQSLGVPGDMSYTCETAGHFYLYQVQASTFFHIPFLFYCCMLKCSWLLNDLRWCWGWTLTINSIGSSW